MNKREEFESFARFCLGGGDMPLDRQALDGFVQRNICDMPLLAAYLVNVRYSPHLLREFIFYHWNSAINAPVGDDALAVAADVMNAIRQALTGEEQERARYCITHNYLLPLSIARKLCAWLENDQC